MKKPVLWSLRKSCERGRLVGEAHVGLDGRSCDPPMLSRQRPGPTMRGWIPSTRAF